MILSLTCRNSIDHKENKVVIGTQIMWKIERVRDTVII